MLVTWSRCEWLTKMWSTFASCSSDMSPTPVPASSRMSSSIRNEVVRRLPPMPPLQPSTLIFIVCPGDADTVSPRRSSPGLRSRWSTDRSIVRERYHARSGRFHGICHTCRVNSAGGRKAAPPGPRSRLVEELHLHAGDLDQVVIAELASLGPEGAAVQCRVGGALHVSDEVAVRSLGDDGDLHARLADRGEVLGQVERATRGCAREHLDRRFAQRPRSRRGTTARGSGCGGGAAGAAAAGGGGGGAGGGAAGAGAGLGSGAEVAVAVGE